VAPGGGSCGGPRAAAGEVSAPTRACGPYGGLAPGGMNKVPY